MNGEIDFKINIESVGQGCSIKIEGNKVSLIIALTILVSEMKKGTNLTKDDILSAVTAGLEHEDKTKSKHAIFIRKILEDILD